MKSSSHKTQPSTSVTSRQRGRDRQPPTGNRTSPALRNPVISADKAALVARWKRSLPKTMPEYYPLARQLQRKLKLVIGPTNSGKTHQALLALRASNNGTYLGPLRLLALEIRDRLQAEGLLISLVTGELQEKVEGARLTAATIEMLSFDTVVDTVVIDEVQMIGDPDRGFAWTQAIIGAPGREVWLLGSPEAEGVVTALAEELQEPLEIIRLERLAPFALEDAATPLAEVPAQSAVVAFSRQTVLALAGALNKQGRSTSIIYGALSPEVRAEQARMFRDGETDIVVATDAIGLGLNLPISRLYFSTHEKYNGVTEAPIAQDLVWQIAGRAGRFGHTDTGRVGALNGEALRYLHTQMASRPAAVPVQFRYAPTWPLIKALGTHLQETRLTPLLAYFQQELNLLKDDPRYIPVLGAAQLEAAEFLDTLPLSLESKLQLSVAPIPLLKGELAPEFLQFAKNLANGHVAPPVVLTAIARQAAQERMEYAVKVLALYCWLHYRWPDIYPHRDAAITNIRHLENLITKALQAQSTRACPQCKTELGWSYQGARCINCTTRG